MEPALYFAEDLIKRLKEKADTAGMQILAGRLPPEDYHRQAGRYRAFEETIETIHDMIRERQEEPLAAVVQRAERTERGR